MPGTQVQCPHCRSVLQSAGPLPAGMRVRCRNCNGAFAVYPTPQAAPKAVPAPPPRANRPAPRPARRGLALLAVAVGALLLLGGGIAVAFAVHALRPSKGNEPVAGLPDKPSDGSGGSNGGGGTTSPSTVHKLGEHWVTAAAPRPADKPVTEGLAWLAGKQQADGGWGAEDSGPPVITIGAPGGEVVMSNKSSVADTSIAALALLRAGSTPHKGNHADQLRKAVAFVCRSVEAADEDSLWVTKDRHTLIQAKLGPHIDTFLALWFLAEAKGHDPDTDPRVTAASDKIIAKMARNQGGDGSWSQIGAWAPILGQAVATKAINRCRQAGVAVPDAVLDNARKHAQKSFDPNLGTFSIDGAADVPLYAVAGNLGALQDSVNTHRSIEKRVATLPVGSPEKRLAEQRREEFRATTKTHDAAMQAVLDRIKDAKFIKGFGKNGGEEFLSYLSISEALAVQGGPEWAKWDKSITDSLSQVRNEDGSWSGYHCVSGRTFCTATALLVLLADRTPVPLAAKEK